MKRRLPPTDTRGEPGPRIKGRIKTRSRHWAGAGISSERYRDDLCSLVHTRRPRHRVRCLLRLQRNPPVRLRAAHGFGRAGRPRSARMLDLGRSHGPARPPGRCEPGRDRHFRGLSVRRAVRPAAGRAAAHHLLLGRYRQCDDAGRRRSDLAPVARRRARDADQDHRRRPGRVRDGCPRRARCERRAFGTPLSVGRRACAGLLRHCAQPRAESFAASIPS